jgi:hypothetical protein
VTLLLQDSRISREVYGDGMSDFVGQVRDASIPPATETAHMTSGKWPSWRKAFLTLRPQSPRFVEEFTYYKTHT